MPYAGFRGDRQTITAVARGETNAGGGLKVNSCGALQ